MSNDPYFDDDYEEDFNEDEDGVDGHYDAIDDAFEQAYEEEEDEFGEEGVRELGDEFEQWNEGIERNSDDGWFYDDEDGADLESGEFVELDDDNY